MNNVEKAFAKDIGSLRRLLIETKKEAVRAFAKKLKRKCEANWESRGEWNISPDDVDDLLKEETK